MHAFAATDNTPEACRAANDTFTTDDPRRYVERAVWPDCVSDPTSETPIQR